MKKEHLLVLMRHAKSDWNAEYRHDFDRPLSKRGRRDAEGMSRWLADQELGSVSLVSSTAVRALETAEYILSELALDRTNFHLEEKLYACDQAMILDVINRQSQTDSTCIIVAHNPALDQTLEFLCPATVRYTDKGKLMTTAAAAILSYSYSDTQTKINSVKLRTLMRPRELV
ncbi:MAG: hypothetical protein GKR93_03160 [Gammaproteobacteria bacterium]|nr:hypothetical protein [Gammaproteobacteria bacterium]